MATVAVLVTNITRLGKAVAKYAAFSSPTAVQKAALDKNVKLLNVNIAGLGQALAAAAAPLVIVPPTIPAPPGPIAAAPDFGIRQEMSATLYWPWVSAWFQARFPDAYSAGRGVPPDEIAAQATADDCLAQVCGCSLLGYPAGIYSTLGDWSLYSALVSISVESGLVEHRVYHMGKLVGTKVGGASDGLAYAKSLGFNW